MEGLTLGGFGICRACHVEGSEFVGFAIWRVWGLEGLES